MMRLFLLAALVVWLPGCQNSTADKDTPEALLAFIPPHFMLADTARGDLNLDGIMDLVMVLSPDADSLSSPENPEERPLLLLLGQKNNTYEEALRHPKVIFCRSCGGLLGDPYQKVSITNGTLTVEHFGGSSWKWARTTTFKYIPAEKDWYLAEDAFVSYHGGDPDDLETRILTPKDFGEVRLSAFNIYD